MTYMILVFSPGAFQDETVGVASLAKTEREALLLLGGIAELERNGAAVNTVNRTELLFPSGKSCELEKVNVRYETGGGFALFSEEADQIAICLGFLGPDPTKDCEIWDRETNSAKAAILTGNGLDYLNKVWKKDKTAFLYPVYDHCQDDQSCVLFFLNYRDGSEEFFPLVAELIAPDIVSFRKMSTRPIKGNFPYSSCLVFIPENKSGSGGKALLLGGAAEKIDPHVSVKPVSFNMGVQWNSKTKDAAKDPLFYKRRQWERQRCGKLLEISSIHSKCMAFPLTSSRGRRVMIGLFGGEDGHPEDHEKVLHTLLYNAGDGVLYYDHGINLPNVCRKAPEYIYKPNINKTEDKLVSKHLYGLKEFSQGMLTAKDRTKVAIIAVGGSRGHGKDSKFNSQVILLNYTAGLKLAVSSNRFSFKRRSMSSVVVPVKFFGSFNCTFRTGGQGDSAAPTLAMHTLSIFNCVLFIIIAALLQ